MNADGSNQHALTGGTNPQFVPGSGNHGETTTEPCTNRALLPPPLPSRRGTRANPHECGG